MRAALILALTLAGCDARDNAPGTDGYRFGKAEFVRTSPVVEIVVHPGAADLQRAAKAAGVTEVHSAAAWSTLNPTDPARPCRIHIVDPAVKYEPEWIGHELMHCAYGRWHP